MRMMMDGVPKPTAADVCELWSVMVNQALMLMLIENQNPNLQL